MLLVPLLHACSAHLEVSQLRQSPLYANSRPVLLEDVPFYAQERYHCGPAALAMMLNWSGRAVSPEELVAAVYVPARQGSFQVEMLAAARRHQRLAYVLKPSLVDLIRELQAGHPVLVLQNLGLQWLPRWHYAVAIGIDLKANEIVLHTGVERRRAVDLELFERTWQRANKWAVVILPGSEMPASALPLPFLKAVNDLPLDASGQALDFYKNAVNKWPKNVPAKMALANMYYALGAFPEAERVLRQCLTLQSDYAPAHNNLAEVLLQRGKHREALQHAQTAVAIGGRHLAQYEETLKKIERMKE